MILLKLIFGTALAFGQGVSTSDELQTPIEPPKFYFGAGGGVGDYSGSNHVKGTVALTGLIGYRLNENVALDFSLSRSRYELVESRCSNTNCSGASEPVEMALNQQNFSLSAKYLFLESPVRPFLGGGVSYVLRNYENSRSYYLAGREIGSLPASTAWNGSLNAGVDLELSSQFHLLTDLKYLFNISYKTAAANDQLTGKLYDAGKPIEELNYYLLSINGVFLF